MQSDVPGLNLDIDASHRDGSFPLFPAIPSYKIVLNSSVVPTSML
jgi:hypothetical protein